MLALAVLTYAFAPVGDADLEAKVQAIFAESCTDCHDAEADDVVLEGPLDHLLGNATTGVPLVKPGDPQASYLYQKLLGADGIEGDPMPMDEDPLPADQLATVRDWITSLEADTEPTPKTEPASAPEPDHEGMVRAIFEDNCTSCHGEGDELSLEGTLDHLYAASSAGMNLVEPGQPERSYLYVKLVGAEGMKGEQMPMGEDPLPPEMLEDVRAWIASMPPRPAGPDEVETLPMPKRKPRPAFGGTHHVSAHTTTTLGKKAIEFRVHHRFGEIRRPFYDRTFFGLASGATMSLGVAHGIVDGLDVLVRWTNVRNGHEVGIKYVPLRQEDGRKLSLGVYASGELFWAAKPLSGCIERTNCLTGNAQVMLSRLWFDRWATQLQVGYSALTNHSPDFVLTEKGEDRLKHDSRGTLDVGVASTVYLDKKRKWGIDAEYFLPLPVDEAFYFHGGNADPDGTKIGGWSLGVSARAGLHFFQVFATSVQNIHTNLVAPGGDTTVPFDRDGAHFFLGFNLSRKWNL